MISSRFSLLCFRLTLATLLLLILHLASTPLHYPVAGQLNDKLSHVLAFYVLAMFGDFSFPRVRFGLSKALPLMAYGLLIEVIQYFLPYRVFSIYDLGADALGVLAYVVSVPLLKQIPALRRRWGF